MNRLALMSALIVAAFLAGLGYIGYLGGEVFTTIAATGTPPASERGLSALFLSSDMGTNVGMGPALTKRFAANGIPLVAVNALTYFRTERSPAQADALLEEGIRRTRALPGTRRLLLIGQSFGADMLQASLARLPASYRRNVIMVVLIVPPNSTLYRASPSGIFDLTQYAVPAERTAKRLDWVPTLCLQGADEDDSLCPLMTSANVTRVRLPGGHMLKFDADRVYAAIAPQVRRVAASQHER